MVGLKRLIMRTIVELQEGLIKELRDQINKMQESTDPLELGKLRIKSEELEKHNETLKKSYRMRARESKT
jgi:predicted hydrolase (HD superfamily)